MKGTLVVASIAILCLSLFSASAPKVIAQQSSGDWPMFRADPSHDGVGTGNPALAPTLLWKSTIINSATGGFAGSSPAVVGGVVYIGSAVGAVPAEQSTSVSVSTGAVYALNAANGAKLWNYTTGVFGFDSSPAVANRIVYIGSFDGNVYALNATNGAKLWAYTTGSSVESSPAVVGGVVYIGSDDGHVYALNAANGTKLWNYTTGSIVESSPAIAGGVVYVVGGSSGYVYALNATSGTKLWSYTTGGGKSSPAVVNGIVYVGSSDGDVYALGASPTSSNILFIIIGAVVVVVIVAAVVFLIFQNRLKTKTKNPPTTPQNSASVSSVQISQR